ncbi:MAG TPA: AAA family ATPase [Thermoflexia bacterium]|jgi:chromosome segregation protein|nr:AAA family ATPase [Thermoflexia bacterium]
MRLKRLELQGYKSFANRTEFLFPGGITAIVGPNGSGKSNIADAIRWALGEQSLRALRGKSTQDMIFSGGKRRARAGMAEVLLTLDNSGGWLPIDYTEVTIGRRAYRSGESEYLLNGQRVRLRDLNHLLAESGLSQRTYAVIGQGLVDTALSLRPQERRALFEEAAGIAVYRAQREEASARLDETERNLERVHDILSEVEPRLRRLEKQVEQFQEYERLSGYLTRLLRTWYGYQWGQAQERLRDVQERVRRLEAELTDRQSETEEVASRLAELRARQAELRTHLRDLYRRTADLHDRADAAQRELATLTERSRLLVAQREQVLQELEPLRAQRDAQSRRVEAARGRVEELRAQVEAQERRLAALQKEHHRLQEEASRRTARRVQIQKEVEALQARLARLEAERNDAQAEEVRLQAEQELLAYLREEGTGTGRGARSLLQARLSGVRGVLSARIRVPEEWETAVEAALGPLAQALVVEGWDVVDEARRRLPPDERAALLPLSDLRPPSVDLPEGAVRAADVVSCDPALRPAVEAILGATLLVPDLKTARSLLPHLPPGSRCVTRAGEVITAEGAVVLGREGRGALAQERAWQALPGKLQAARQRREEREKEIRKVKEKIETLQTALQKVEQEAHVAAQAVAQAESGPLAEARTELAVAQQALENQRLLLQRELSILERLKAQIVAQEERAQRLQEEYEAAQRRLAQLKEETETFERERIEARSRIGPAEAELSRLSEEESRLMAEEQRCRQRVRGAEALLNAARLDLARCEDQLTRLQERIREELGLVELEVAEEVTTQTPLPLRPLVSPLPVVEVLPEGLQEEIQRLKVRLHQLGPVNPNAPQEYDEAMERYRFLSEQVADLEAASERLREVIADLDRMMEQAFRETFDAIAAAFEETFTRLFNGGTARLELTDPDDLMTTGVEIVARPPGKRLQSLALLSGGERALTAAALIFAILQVRPTPFCVLDEVDAMLDEANVARFRAMLEELSSRTQFIVITHNRGTVEAADTVYGISMGSDGVSQVVSLRLEGHDVEEK